MKVNPNGVYEFTEEDRARLRDALSAFSWRRHVVMDREWVATLKFELGVEVERVVRQAIANGANPAADLYTARYDVCTDWVVDRAVSRLQIVETFAHGEGI